MTQYFCVLEGDVLFCLDAETKKEEKLLIHMGTAKIKTVPSEPLFVCVLTGTEEIQFKALNIKQKVEWTNALVNANRQAQGKIMNERSFRSSSLNISQGSPETKKKKLLRMAQDIEIQDWGEELSLVFCSKIFKPDAPFFNRLAKVWDQESALEEATSQLLEKAALVADLNLSKEIKQLSKSIFENVQDIKVSSISYTTAKR